MKKNNLALGMINESRDYIKKLGEFILRPAFAYALTNLTYHIRQSKSYEGLYTLYISGLPVYVDCNHSEIVNEVEIPKITCRDTVIRGEVIVLKREFADKVRECLDKNKAVVKPIITIEEVEKLGLIEDLKKKHSEEKPGRDLWDYEADKGVPRVFKVIDKRMVDVKIHGEEQESPMFDIVDVETGEELSVWGFQRLLNAWEAEGVYVTEYNGKSAKGHSFWITDVTKEYEEGKGKGKK